MQDKQIGFFVDTLSKPQHIWGFIYLPLHIFVLPLLLAMLAYYLPSGLDEASVQIIYYAFGFAFCLICMWKYLRNAFDILLDNKARNFTAVLFSYVIYTVLGLAVSALLLWVLGDEVLNPNNEAVTDMANSSYGVVLGLAVFIAPIVEETLFRGVLFGSLVKKNRALAFAASIVAFGVYHIWQYALVSMDWRTLIYALQYIPAGYAFAWLYEKTSCIWLPIFLHMGINMFSLFALT